MTTAGSSKPEGSMKRNTSDGDASVFDSTACGEGTRDMQPLSPLGEQRSLAGHLKTQEKLRRDPPFEPVTAFIGRNIR